MKLLLCSFCVHRTLSTKISLPSIAFQLKNFSKLCKFKVKPFLLKPVTIGCIYGLRAIPFCYKQVQCKSKGVLPSRAKELAKRYQNRNQPTLTWNDLWSVLRPSWIWLVGAVICAILVAVINIRIPLLLGDLVNVISQLNGDSYSGLLKPIAFQLVFSYAAQACLTFLRIAFISFLGERVATSMRMKLFGAIISQDMSFFDTERTGELTARLNNDVLEFKSAFKHCIGHGLRTVAEVGGAVVSLYFISGKMTAITLTTLPVIIGAGTIFGHFLRVISRLAQAQTAVASGVAEEAFGNIRTVRSFAMEYSETTQYYQEITKMARLNEYLGLGIGLFQAMMHLTMNGLVLGVLYGGAGLINSNQMQPGDLMSYLVTSQSIMRALGQFSVLFGDAVKGYTAAARIFEFIHYRPQLRLFGGVKIPYHSMMGEILFENVTFTYPARPEHVVFDRLNLKIPPGKVVALVGSSGAGKSTIASLLEQFYLADIGRITLDGYDITELDPDWLRGQTIGFISQEPVLFGASIKENIRYGKPDASDAEIIHAARLANAHNFIVQFPHGYGTSVGERGVTLSGGQKQRIAIARALLKNPPILILDEATSALDAESEKLVHDALERAMRDRTVLIIAHRLSTVQNADLIAVISNKHVAELGTHDTLMKQKGIYWSLVKAQTDIE